jgi:hypothetical protein
MGHTPSVFERSYAKVYEDAQDMKRRELASRPSGSACDQLTNR